MAIAYVQSAESTTGGTTAAYGSNNTLGNFLLCSVQGINSSTVPTDSRGNTWLFAGGGAGGFVGYSLYYAMNCKAGANTVTPAGVFTYGQFSIYEFSGVALTSAFDQISVVDSGGSPSSGTSVTTTANGELVFTSILARITTGTSYATFTPSAGWTLGQKGEGLQAGFIYYTTQDGYEVQAAAGAIRLCTRAR